MALKILEMVFPVVLMFLLGALCARRRIISPEGLTGIKSVVSNITLPVVLFNAFFTAEYNGRIAVTFLVVYLSCAAGLGLGFVLRRFLGKYGKFLPFLVTNFEGGMLGYALFGLLYPGQTPVFAMVDIGQTLAAFTTFMITLILVGGGSGYGTPLVKKIINPTLIGIVLGVVLGVTGVGRAVMSSAAGPLFGSTVSFVTAPTSALILIIVGYELAFRRELMKPVLLTTALRLGVCALLTVAGALVIFAFIPFDKQLLVALMLAWSLPAPFIIPLYADITGHSDYISTTLSLQTIVSMLLFVGIAAYSLA